MLFGVDSNLDLAQALFDLGGIRFGAFDLGPTAGRSPLYINPRVLISEPAMLRRVARLIHTQIQADRARRRPHLATFAAVAGVPMGGLHIATAYALESDMPLIYLRPDGSRRRNGEGAIEGRIVEGQSALVIDDLMTGGSSILGTCEQLERAGMTVRDAIVLIDREQGGVERLHGRGCRVTPILRLKTMLNYYHAAEVINDASFERCMDYLHEREDAAPPAADDQPEAPAGDD